MINKDARKIAVIGGGPAGLMAAETIAGRGWQVDLYDAMPSVGRKFLLAGKGGMNLTHSEPLEPFLQRYGKRQAEIAGWLQDFGPDALRAWAEALGIATFVGSSGRVFPVDMKAAPLLRAWLHRMRSAGVRFHMRHRWTGWSGDALRFATPEGEHKVQADAVVLALGGGSWARLGSDGAWVQLLQQKAIEVAPLQPANCGFDVGWSEHFRQRHAGQPLTSVIARVKDLSGAEAMRQGQFVITEGGVEGSLIYALSAPLRDLIAAEGQAVLYLDLAPGKSQQRIDSEVMHPRGARSWSSHLQGKVGLDSVKIGLLRECLTADEFQHAPVLARAVKSLPVRLRAPRPIDEAISSAGGVAFAALDRTLMLRALPGVFCAGEMLDWEAPTGGYLLTACFAGGKRAGLGVLDWLDNKK
ncbi:TIGR03862 family flavoprotein [Undibacterium sp.]|uniref:TIGR03862 family flavoprotein n=1 Tax=Undibacterium sp. TaxID=1914977 RepID=UPI002CFCD3B6|nr:TIGR03862 family flavoprotein [Undibacterium sp.]HTD04126.1 TIGR03862 family flavoprotein [Undibacterium sp.]